MSKPVVLTTEIKIKLDGADVDRTVMAGLSALTVDQHAHLPGMFTICLPDPELKLLDNGPFDLTKDVEITATTTAGNKITLIKGEITALEPEFSEGMIATLVVRGYDKSHRLYREHKTKTFKNVKDSDLAEQIAKAAQLQPEVESTKTVYEHVFQHNQSDLAFLTQRAWRLGFECFVADEKLYFRKPPKDNPAVNLTWGKDLLSFMPRMTLAEQVDEVVVKGWDVDRKAPIIGKATKGQLYPDIGQAKEGSNLASAFGQGKVVIVDQPVVSQAEADILAAARLNELSGAFIEAEGVAFRRPDITAGQQIALNALGERLSGNYLVTGATHTYTAEGFRTTFSVQGTRKGLMTEQILAQPASEQGPGVAPAIVTNTDDPKKWGRVKVKYPWLSDEVESDWARVVYPGAGPDAGFCLIPAVDDEVLVAFANGNFSQPYVLGGLWNGKHQIVTETAAASSNEMPLVRSWRSRSGHWLAMYDDASNKVEIVTQGGHRLILDDANGKVTIESKGEIEVKAASDLKIKAGGNLDVEAGGQMNLQASGPVVIKGTTIDLN